MAKNNKKATHIGMVTPAYSTYGGRSPEAKEMRLRETPKMFITEDGDYRFSKSPDKYLSNNQIVYATRRGSTKWSRTSRVSLDLSTIRKITDKDRLEYYSNIADSMWKTLEAKDKYIQDQEKRLEDFRKTRDAVQREYNTLKIKIDGLTLKIKIDGLQAAVDCEGWRG